MYFFPLSHACGYNDFKLIKMNKWETEKIKEPLLYKYVRT